MTGRRPLRVALVAELPPPDAGMPVQAGLLIDGLRAEGIWAQHVCETPLVHWTLGLEAFEFVGSLFEA